MHREVDAAPLVGLVDGMRTGVNVLTAKYLNRLSDALFVLARVAAGEVEPRSRTDEPRG